MIHPIRVLPRSLMGLGSLSAGLALVLAAGPLWAAPKCTFLQPIGGSGDSRIVSKQVGRGKLLGRTNWNTDFIVDAPYSFYRFFFTANSSSGSARFPVSGHMKFNDGSNLKMFDETLKPEIGKGREFGPFDAVPGKQASQMNFKVGASKDPEATGFSYRISVMGCR